VFGCMIASAFEATIATHPFSNTSKVKFYWWDLMLIVARPQNCKKQQFAASWVGKLMNSGACSTVHGFSLMNSGACSTVPTGPVWFNAKNALNRVRSNKIKKIFLIFNCVLFEKLMLNIIQWHYKLDEDRLKM